MADKAVRRERKPIKTWSLLGDVKRVPSTYEVVTSKFHYHFRKEPAPFELDPETPINLWYLKHREGSAVQLDDWEQFRDPARLTYRDYVMLQDRHETYLDHLIDQAEKSDSLENISADWLKILSEFMIPLRFPLHVLQMTSLYVGQMAPSSFITNCANFQAADEMRRIQRIAYWTKSLANKFGQELAATEYARETWESGEAWQPLRMLCEELLVTYDWAESWVALNLAVKPQLDALINWEFAALAQAHDDEFLELMFKEFQVDSERSKNWSLALVEYIDVRDETQVETIRGWVTAWQERAQAAVAPLVELLKTSTVAPPSSVGGHLLDRAQLFVV